MQDKTILYGSSVSPCTQGVRTFLKITNIPHEFKEINLATGDQKTEEYKKLNPFQKVPVLDDKGFVLRESTVMSRYLANSQNVPDHWYPKDPAKRAQVDLALEYWGQNSSRFFAIAFQAFGRNDLTKEKAQETNDAAIKEFEDVFLKDKKFAAGDQHSLADLPFLFYLLGQPYFLGGSINYDKHQRLTQWIADLYKAEPRLKEQVIEYQENVKVAFAKK